ncbi:MAG: superoxide dismutase family protein [Syntrophotaleaceae bacterium]
MKRYLQGIALPVFCLLLITVGCERKVEGQQKEGEVTKAVAQLQPTKGNQASGTVTFESRDGGIRVTADLTGLEPGRHGFHIHEFGDCSAPDASSAGDHYNPTGTPHGAPTDPPEKRHVGDLGNLEADAEGKAHLEMVDPVIALDGENSIVGKAVVIHAQPDDLTSQPAGNAGPRVACGVIEPAQ